MQNHTAVGRVMATLEDTHQVVLKYQSILNAYLHFEAMTEHQYTCVHCGYHPVVLIMDLNKKGALRLPGIASTCTNYLLLLLILTFFFAMLVSDLSVPPCTEYYDHVNMEQFWTQVENEVVARGLCKGTANLSILSCII